MFRLKDDFFIYISFILRKYASTHEFDLVRIKLL